MAGTVSRASHLMRVGKFSSAHSLKRARIEIIPLIDVMFFLLASFMMVGLSMSKMKSIKVDLPKVRATQKDLNPDLFNIAISKSGETYVGKEALALPEILGRLTNVYRVKTNLHVYVSGDANATHGSVLRVLSMVRSAGIQRVQFATQPVGNANRP